MKISSVLLALLFMATVSSTSIRTLLWDDPYCNTFSPDGSCCLKCSYRCFMNKHEKCQPVSDWCKTWNDKSGDCTSCYDGYGDPVKGVCKSTPVTGGQTGDNCAEYGYMDSKKKIFKTWFSGCKKVCIQCDNGYYLDYNKACVALPKNCQAADQYGECTDCKKGYKLQKGNCVAEYNKPKDNCAEYGYIDDKRKWLSAWTKGCKEVCKQCNKGYYLDQDYKCKVLPQNCKSADIYGNCVECQEDYYLEDDACFSNEDNCKQYGYIDSNNKWLKLWKEGCKRVCKECDEGYYLDKDYICVALPKNCKAADSQGKCTSCDDGYSVQNGICIAEDENCAEYGYLDAKRNWVTNYKMGFKKACRKCDEGYYLNPNYKCETLPDNCKVADSDGKCTECAGKYQLKDGKCVDDKSKLSNNDDDHCAEYGFIDGNKKWRTYYTEGFKKACRTCHVGYYPDTNYKCQRLPINCSAADHDGNCTNCDPGCRLVGGKCILQ